MNSKFAVIQSLMLLSYIWVLLLITGLSVLPHGQAVGQVSGESTELDQLRGMLEDGHVFHAKMIHRFYDSYTEETQETEGEIWITKDQYKVTVEHQSVLVDGDISRVYNSAQNKLVISEYEPAEDDFAPSRFFSETEDIYQVEERSKEDNATVFVLTSDDPFELFLRVVVRLDEELRPLEVEAIDQMENRVHTYFRESEFLSEHATDKIFQLRYPDDAQIIDLRE